MPKPPSTQKLFASFQFKLFLVFTLLTLVMTSVLSIIYITNQIKEKRNHADESVDLLSRQLAVSVRLPLYAENNLLLAQIIEEVVKTPEIGKIVISTRDGRVLAQAGSLSESADKLVKTTAVDSNPMALSPETAITAENPEAAVVIGYVRLERDMGGLKSMIRNMVINVTVISLLFWLSVTVLCFLVLRKVTSSFNALVHGVEKMCLGDYQSRISIVSRDEPGRVGMAINQLAETLWQREEENQRLHSKLIQAEQMARENERSIKNLLDSLPVGIIWSGRDGKIQYANNFLVERFGLDSNAACTAPEWFKRVTPDEENVRRITESRSAVMLEDGEDCAGIISYEARMTATDGSERSIILSTRTINNKIVDLLIDVTDRELLQNQLLKIAKLESLGVLAAGIAHNFNNVLTGVMGYITYAQKFLENSHKSFEPLELAVSASQRAAELAKQLMAFARGGAPDKKPVALEKLVMESTLLAVIGTQTHHSLQVAPQLHMVNADASQLHQAFSCIAINAVQSMPSGGRLIIRLDNCRLEAGNNLGLPRGEYVEILFEDQGGGIPEENRKNIFVPYFTTKANVGSGLGLATTHTIISGHGGTITFRSIVGEGTTFTIYLPALEKTDNQP